MADVSDKLRESFLQNVDRLDLGHGPDARVKALKLLFNTISGNFSIHKMLANYQETICGHLKVMLYNVNCSDAECSLSLKLFTLMCLSLGPDNDELLGLLLPTLLDNMLFVNFNEQLQLETIRAVGLSSVLCSTKCEDPQALNFCRNLLETVEDVSYGASLPLLKAGALHCWCLLSFGMTDDTVCMHAKDFLLDAVQGALGDPTPEAERAGAACCGLTLARIREAALAANVPVDTLRGDTTDFADCVSLFHGASKQYTQAADTPCLMESCRKYLNEPESEAVKQHFQRVRVTGAWLTVAEFRVAVVLDCVWELLGTTHFHGVLKTFPVIENIVGSDNIEYDTLTAAAFIDKDDLPPAKDKRGQQLWKLRRIAEHMEREEIRRTKEAAEEVKEHPGCAAGIAPTREPVPEPVVEVPEDEMKPKHRRRGKSGVYHIGHRGSKHGKNPIHLVCGTFFGPKT